MSQYAPDLFDPKKKLKNYKDYTTYFIIGYVIVLGILLTIGLSSCNTTTRAYKAIERHEPKKSEDTARLLKRAAPLLKTPAPKIVPGKTIRIPYPVTKFRLDSSLLNKMADSISKRYQSDGVQITKDCENSIKVEIAKYYRYGVQEGYDQAIDSLSKQTYDSTTPTTIYIPNDSLAAVLITTRIDLNKANGEVIKQTAKKDTYRGLFWVLLALLIVSGALNVKQLLSTKNLIKKYPEL
jgi:hypothetical protein